MNLQPVSKKFHRTDDILKGFTFGYLIVQLQKRKVRLTRDKVRDIFAEYLQRHVIEARQAFEDHLDDLMEKIDQHQSKGGWLL